MPKVICSQVLTLCYRHTFCVHKLSLVLVKAIYLRMKKLIFLYLFTSLSQLAISQTGTEVYLFDLKKKGKSFTLSNPVNISNNKGYDNQPSFLPDGTAILFASTKGDQTDIVKYTITTQKKTKLTHTTGSEYSPIVMPNGTHFSTILLEKDGRQLLWKYPISGGVGEIAIPKLVIGYHCWYDANTLFSFVLGEQFTLQKSILSTGVNQVMATNIGRSLHRIPKSSTISYIQKDSTKTWLIQQMNPETGQVKTISETLDEVEDMAWTPKGTMLMGKKDVLFKLNPKKDSEWVEVCSLAQFNLKGITRLAVSPQGNKLVLVVNEE